MPFTRWFNRLGRAQLVGIHCISVLAGKSVTFLGEFLSSSTELRFGFIVRRPVLGMGHKREVRLRITAGAASVSDGDEHCHVDQVVHGRLTQVQVRLTAPAIIQQERITLEVFNRKNRWRIGALEFDRLNTCETQRVVQEHLSVESQRLWVVSGDRQYPGDCIPNTSAAVVPELTLSGSRLASFLPAWGAILSFSLLAAERQITLGEVPLTIDGEQTVVRGPVIPVCDNPLIASPGSYRIVAALAGRPIAMLPFRVVGTAELLGQIKVTRIQIEAQSRDGGVIRSARVLRAQEPCGLRVSVGLRTEILAPRTAFPCLVQLLQDHNVLISEQFSFPLARLALDFTLPRIELGNVRLPSQARRVRLRVVVSVGGERKGVATLVVLPAQAISNFEGQLKLDPRELVLDEGEYSRILRHLGMEEAEMSHRRFWQKRA